jgi:hypothetical protein
LASNFPVLLIFISNTMTLKKSLFSLGSLCLTVPAGPCAKTAASALSGPKKLPRDERFRVRDVDDDEEDGEEDEYVFI